MSFIKPESILPHLGLSSGKVVADIGAGTGHYTFLMSPLVGMEGRVYAIDIQKDLVEKLAREAKERGFRNVEAIWGDVENIGGTKLREGAVDFVMISNVLFQVESKSGLVAEIKRILKKNGKVVIIDWSESFAGLGPASNSVVTSETAKRLFENNGFVLEKSFEAGAHHYGLVFRHVV